MSTDEWGIVLGGIDLETTGLSFEDDYITEVGFVVWSTRLQAPLYVMSEYLYSHQYPPLSEEITKITGITDGMLKTFGRHPWCVLRDLIQLFSHCDYIVAHNGNEFDLPMLESNLKRYFGDEAKADLGEWIDTSTDIPYDDRIRTRHLNYLASEHNYINYHRHRAVFDVMTMLEITSRYDITEVIAYKDMPCVEIEAACAPPWTDGGSSTGKAKALGFRWNGDKRKWLQTVKQHKLDELKKKAEAQALVLKQV